MRACAVAYRRRARIACMRQATKNPPCAGFVFADLVPTEGFEPPHLAAHGPEPCASTNSATWAFAVSAIIQVFDRFDQSFRL